MSPVSERAGRLIRGLFVQDWSARKLLEYEMQGKIPAGKGPIVEVHDGSGSMGGPPFVWASSLAGVLCMIAKREKRAFVGIEFGSRGEVRSWYFPKDEDIDPDKLLDFVSHFYGGGTHTAGGMAEALRIIETEAAFTTADVILIGDGQDRFGAEDLAIRDRLRALDVRIHGITIATGANPYFEQMCEWHVDVTDLAGANEGTDAIAENIT